MCTGQSESGNVTENNNLNVEDLNPEDINAVASMLREKSFNEMKERTANSVNKQAAWNMWYQQVDAETDWKAKATEQLLKEGVRR